MLYHIRTMRALCAPLAIVVLLILAPEIFNSIDHSSVCRSYTFVPPVLFATCEYLFLTHLSPLCTDDDSAIIPYSIFRRIPFAGWRDIRFQPCLTFPLLELFIIIPYSWWLFLP